MASFEIITQPTSEPVTLLEAKAALRVLHDDDDDRITNLIKTSREFAERYCGIFIMATVREIKTDEFPSDEFNLDTWPLQSIDSIKYDDTSSPVAELTLTVNTDYYTDVKTEGGRVRVIDGWPSIAEKPNAVRIRMTAGYANADSVPEGIKEGIKAHVIFLYDRDSDMMTVSKSLLWPYRRYL